MEKVASCAAQAIAPREHDRDHRSMSMARQCSGSVRKQRRQRLQRIGLGDRLVLPPAQHSRKAHRDAAFMAAAAGNSFEAELEEQRRLHAAHRAEAFDAWFCG